MGKYTIERSMIGEYRVMANDTGRRFGSIRKTEYGWSATLCAPSPIKDDGIVELYGCGATREESVENALRFSEIKHHTALKALELLAGDMGIESGKPVDVPAVTMAVDVQQSRVEFMVTGLGKAVEL